MPNARLIAVLRNPIERAYSHWQHSLRKGGETITDFERALAVEEERIASDREKIFTNPVYFPRAYGDFSYKLRGRYAEHLELWLAAFPREQLLVVQSERLFANPQHVLTKEVFPFLGIAPEVETIEFNAQNVGGYETPISSETRSALCDYFAPHNAKLETLLDMKFDWL